MRILKPFLIAIFATIFVWSSANASDFGEFFSEEGINLRIQSTFEKPVTLESRLYSVTATATSGIPIPPDPIMPPYNIKLWVTVGSEANANDQPRDTAFIGFVIPDPNDPIISTDLTTTFRLPTPGNPNPSNELQQDLTAADLIGETVYIKLCLEKISATTVCAVDTFPIHPNRPGFGQSPSLEEVNQATVYWETLPQDNSESLGHGHRISFTNKNDSADTGSLYFPQNNNSDAVVYNGILRNRLRLQSGQSGPTVFSPRPGEAYQARLQACGQPDDICSQALIIQNVTSFSSEFTASAGTDTDAVIVEWLTHAPDTPRYTLERCEVSDSNSCTTIEPPSNSTTYRDAGATPGTSYRYTIYACPGTALPCTNNLIATGITNAGFRALETPDPAEFVTASDGSLLNEIEVSWSEFSPNATNFSDPGYEVVVTDPAFPATNISQKIAYETDQANIVLNSSLAREIGLPSGVLLNFAVRTCANLFSASPQCANSLSVDSGYARARFPVSSPSAGTAQISWVQFSMETKRYRLERCPTTTNPECDIIEVGEVLSHNDDDATENESYIYSVYACSSVTDNGSCVKTGDTDSITIASNVLPDVYEADDSPFELNQPNQTIQASVAQSRSFHTATDLDWVRITFGSGIREFDIRTTSSLEELDTQLTLFDADGDIAGCALNTPEVITGNARLRLPDLAAGEYFLRIEQQPGGPEHAPVENYTLSVTISVNSSGSRIEFPDCSVVEPFPEKDKSLITPILQLLLLE